MGAWAVPAAERREWLRDAAGKAESWWYFNSGLAGARRQLLRECFAAIRGERAEGGGGGLARAVGHPAFPLAMLLGGFLLLGAVTHDFRETRSLAQVPDSRTVLITAPDSFAGHAQGILSSRFSAWPRYQRSLETYAAYLWQREPDGGITAHVQPEFFNLTGMRAVSGRLPAGGAPCPNCAASAGEFGIGRVVQLGGHPYEVIGTLAPETSFGTVKPRFWTPLSTSNLPRTVGAIGRLREGVSLAAAERDLGAEVVPLSYFRRETIQFLAVALLLALAIAIFRVTHDRVFWAYSTGPWRRSVRFWTYFAIKTGLVAALLCMAAIESRYGLRPTPSGARDPFVMLISTWPLMVLFGLALWWSWADQRFRCRTCLRRLERPVHMGVMGASMFDPTGVESVCPSGHGALYVPDTQAGEAAWITLDEFFSRSEP